MYQFQTLQYVAGDSYFLHGAVCLGVQTFDFTFQATWDRSKGIACSSCPEAIHTYFRHLRTHRAKRVGYLTVSTIRKHVPLVFV